MNKRTIFVLRDSVEGKFYISRSITLGEFDRAIIHTTLASVKSGLKDRVRDWKYRRESITRNTHPDGPTAEFYAGKNEQAYQQSRVLWHAMVDEFRIRECVKDFGIEIVPIEIEIP